MNERLEALLTDLTRADGLSGAELHRAARRAAWVAELAPTQLAELWNALLALALPLGAAADRLLTTWLAAAVQARRQAPLSPTEGTPPQEATLDTIARLYQGLGKESRARGQLLAWLAMGTTDAELNLLTRLLIDDPLEEDQDVIQTLAPFFQQRRGRAAELFPRLLRGLASPPLAAPVLDLANFLVRERLVPQHPAADVAGELSELLGELVQTLLQMEERPQDYAQSPQEIAQRVARAIALAVSLCDALALIGDRQAIGKLYQALAVGHRRLRTEAAAALARLGEAQGATELVRLAAEPVARLRVLEYARELGLEDQIEPQFATPAARAEAELCVWLAEPTQYGVPPNACELVDQRRQHWPGFDEAVDCFLFRFQYVVTIEGEGERSFSNVGIAGPLVHAFVADLADLPPEDIYAAFAGWHAQHEEIREFDVARLSTSERLEVDRLKRRLHDAGYSDLEPQRLGYFFGEKALVALAERQGTPGVAVADFHDTLFFSGRNERRPLGVEEAYSIYKGRKLLKAFNR